MLESEYKYKLLLGLAGRYWDVQAHEDSVSNFIPDISFAVGKIDGWIEVKYSDTPPKMLNSVGHWTRGQEKWLRERGSTGSGYCYMLYGTQEASYMFHWSTLKHIRLMKWFDAIKCAAATSEGAPSISGVRAAIMAVEFRK